jgi:enamine deaminase RidA (YjgF/YER057c/UK114 family)
MDMALKIERFQPEGMNIRMSGGQPSYSHVVSVSGPGKLVYTAGQLARDIDGNCVGKGDMRAQMEQVREPRPVFESGGGDVGGRGEDQYVRHGLR